MSGDEVEDRRFAHGIAQMGPERRTWFKDSEGG